MEIKIGDYVKYTGKVYSVANQYSDDSVKLIRYKDLEILVGIPRSEVERLTDFHVSVMRFNKELPPRRFEAWDAVKIRAKLDSECVYSETFSGMRFSLDEEYIVDDVFQSCRLTINGFSIHEFEVELVEEN